MKHLILTLSFLFLSSHAFAFSLTEAVAYDTLAEEFHDLWDITNMDLVIDDSLIGEQLYKVSYSLVTEWDCASDGVVDFCGPKDDDSIIEQCHYFLWDSVLGTLERTEHTCDVDPEVAGDVTLIDEL